jgi:hypothetical protein
MTLTALPSPTQEPNRHSFVTRRIEVDLPVPNDVARRATPRGAATTLADAAYARGPVMLAHADVHRMLAEGRSIQGSPTCVRGAHQDGSLARAARCRMLGLRSGMLDLVVSVQCACLVNELQRPPAVTRRPRARSAAGRIGDHVHSPQPGASATTCELSASAIDADLLRARCGLTGSSTGVNSPSSVFRYGPLARNNPARRAEHPGVLRHLKRTMDSHCSRGGFH